MRTDDVRRKYPKGTRVRLLEMDDIQAPPIGTEGTVNHIDDMGTIHISWDNGSSLRAVLEGGDRIEVIR